MQGIEFGKRTITFGHLPQAGRQIDKSCFNSKRKRFPKTQYTKRLIELLIVTSRFETWVKGTASTLKASRMFDTIAKQLHKTNIRTTTICMIAKLCCSRSNCSSLIKRYYLTINSNNSTFKECNVQEIS